MAAYLRLTCATVSLVGVMLAQSTTPSQATNPAPATPSATSSSAASSPDLPTIRTTVSVNETISSEAPSAITVLNEKEVEQVPGINLDDRLRQVPGFSLFRRSSSIVANPTTQGVSLREIGSTGASRALVLWDGLPINDPFGGWIYWTRINPSYIDRVEVDRGAGTSVFGDRALGGTISLFSPEPEKRDLFAEYLGGNEDSHDLAAGYSDRWGNWGLSVNSRAFTTDGYYITPSNIRGTADDRANSQFATGELHLDYAGALDHFSLHFDALAEERHNGTVLTHNSTALGTLGANYSHSLSNDQVSIQAFHTREQYHSTYSSVSLARNFESLTSRQTVPAEDIGGAAFWKHHATRWNLLAGADVDDTHGTSFDYSYNTHRLTPSGGTLLEHGLFAQGDFSFSSARLFGGIRHQFTGRDGTTFVSPNGGLTVALKKQLRYRITGYRAFRAPTLNELFRPFRVGNINTLANAKLVPEKLTGVETGFDWTYGSTQLSATLFHNDLQDLIDNQTLTITKSLITRQRVNFPGGLSRGFEFGVSHHWNSWMAEAGYVYADARFSSGTRFPQIPKQQGTASLTYSHNGTLVSAGVRAFGVQFDDDLNQFALPGYATVQLSAQQRITAKLSAVAAVENLLDRTYLVALTPNPNTGAPLLWRIGLRWRGSIR